MSMGEYIGAGSGTTKLLLHLNGNSTDSSGNSHSGTDTDITYSLSNGKFNEGASFNGTTSKVQIAHHADLNFAKDEDFTVSTWTKGATDNSKMLVEKWATGTGYPYRIAYSSGGKIYGARYDGTNNPAPICTFTLSTTIWNSVIFTKIGSTLSLYINGALNITATDTTTGDTTNTADLYLGCRNGTSLFLNGKQDEVIIENVGWTASQVRKYYTNAVGRFNQ